MDKIITDEAFLIKHAFDLYMKDCSLETKIVSLLSHFHTSNMNIFTFFS